MTRTLTVEGDVTAVDTRTLLTTQGSVTAPSLVVPANTKKIDKVVVSCAVNSGTANGRASYFVRLGGPAVLGGEQAIVVGAQGSDVGLVGSIGGSAAPFVLENADIAVSASDTVSISAEMAGQDLGTAQPVVTLVFA